MSLRLGQKLSLGVCLLVASLTGSIMAMVNLSASRTIQRVARDSLAATKKIFDQFEQARFQQLLSSNSILAEVPQLKAVVTTPDVDRATLFDSAQAAQQLVQSDLLILSDARGKLLSSVTEPQRYGDNLLENAAFARALSGGFYQGIWSTPRGIFQVVASPFRFGDQVMGAVLTGFEINEEAVETIEKMSNCHILILSPERQVTSRASRELFQQLQQRLQPLVTTGEGEPQLLKDAGGGQYLLLAAPLASGGASFILVRSLAEETLPYRQLQSRMLMTAGLILLAALALSVLFSQRITQPIQVLVEETRRIAKGDLTSKIGVSSGDELGELAGAFNQMTSQLDRLLKEEKELAAEAALAQAHRQRAQELEQLNLQLTQEIAGRTLAEEELRRAYEELKKVQRQLVQSEKLSALGQFSAGVAHEVKNPLGIILGGTQLLQRRIASEDAETHTVLKMIREAVERADGIVRGLSQFAKPSPLKRERINSRQLVEEALSFLEYRASLKNVQIDTQQTLQDGLWVEVDKNQIQQVLFNVFLNAVEAMPGGGALTVKTYRSTEAPSTCVIEVADTGEGISREHLDRLFEPFFTTKRDQKGTGLGLSVSKTIVENHEGTIAVESEQGHGTQVTITLPLAEGVKR